VQHQRRREVASADAVGLYLDEVSDHLLLTAEDEVRLARLIERGRAARAELATRTNLEPGERLELEELAEAGEEAKLTFIRCNLRLVISIAKRYTGRGLDLLDLIQEGNLGLIRAVEKFDWRRGFKFSTYATWWIRQAISRGLGNHGRTIRLPVHMVDVVRAVADTRQHLTEELRRPPTLQEIADTSGIEPEKVRVALEAPADTVSLDRPVGADGEAELHEFVADEIGDDPYASILDRVQAAQVRQALQVLTEQERRVITLRFGLEGGEPATLADVGRAIGTTRERVRQIESRALAKLRHPSCRAGLDAFL
jgi:RNA polymerase primary sigma factor